MGKVLPYICHSVANEISQFLLDVSNVPRSFDLLAKFLLGRSRWYATKILHPFLYSELVTCVSIHNLGGWNGCKNLWHDHKAVTYCCGGPKNCWNIFRACCLDVSPSPSQGIYHWYVVPRYTPISESEFEDMIFSQVYRPGISSLEEAAHPHLLAILLAIMALGTLMDTQRESHSREARHYYQLSRSALSLRTVLEEQSVDAVRALVRKYRCRLRVKTFKPASWPLAFAMPLHVFGQYRKCTMGDSRISCQARTKCEFLSLWYSSSTNRVTTLPGWTTWGHFAFDLCSNILIFFPDRDSGVFNLNASETATRRSLLWELYTYDSLQVEFLFFLHMSGANHLSRASRMAGLQHSHQCAMLIAKWLRQPARMGTV